MIVIIKFIDGVHVRNLDADCWDDAVIYGVKEVALHTVQVPTVEHYPDGAARNGYLKFKDGPEFNLDNVASWEVIPGGGREPEPVLLTAKTIQGSQGVVRSRTGGQAVT